MTIATLVILAATVVQRPMPTDTLSLRVDGEWRTWRAWDAAAAPAPDTLLARAITWHTEADGLRVGDFLLRTGNGVLVNSVAVVDLDPVRFRLSLSVASGAARRNIADVMRDSSIVVAANTGLFRENGTPQGLVLVGGVRHSSVAGWLDAAVVITGGVAAPAGVAGARAAPSGASGFQSLPWLVRDDRIAYGVSSGLRLSPTHRDRRLTMCFGQDGRLRFALSNFEVFGATVGRVPIGLTIPEQAIIAAALGCRDAIALDGGISAQLAVRTAGGLQLMPGWRRVPVFLIVRRR